MGLNTTVFQEPRGVMRVLQLIFAISAFATTTGFWSNFVLTYCNVPKQAVVVVDYPFALDSEGITLEKCEANGTAENFRLAGDFSSDAQFFVATGVLSMLYTMGISVVYVMFDAAYQSNPFVPMGDFLLTVVLAVFWLSGSAAWANGIDGLKAVTSHQVVSHYPICSRITCVSSTMGTFSGLNTSVILGFLNFFLWASDLWFLYKETQWFKNANPPTSSPGLTAA